MSATDYFIPTFLAQASKAFAEAGLDYHKALKTVCDILTKDIGSHCVIRLISEDGTQFIPVAFGHRDPEIAKRLAKVLAPVPVEPNSGCLDQIVTSTSAYVIHHPTLETAPLFRLPQYKILFEEVGVSSVLLAPLRVPGKMIGSVSLTRDRGQPIYSEQDQILVRELADRAALTIENARLYQEKTHSLRLLESIVANAPIGFALVDREMRFLKANEALAKISGIAVECFKGKLLREVAPESLVEQIETRIRNVFETGQPILNQETVRPDPQNPGRFKYRLSSSYPVKSHAGEITAVGNFVIDVTESKNLARRVELKQKRLEDIVSQIPGIVWEARGVPGDPERKLDFISRYAETMTGYPIDDWLTKPNFWLSILHPDDRQRALDASTEKYSNGHGGTTQQRWVARDGHEIQVESSSIPILNDAGETVGLRGVTMDITERKKSETERAELFQAMRRAIQMRDEFISVASHELKTPLTSLKLQEQVLSKIVCEFGVTPESMEHIISIVGSIDGQIDRLIRLVNDMLDVSRMSTGKLSMALESLDLGKVVHASLDRLGGQFVTAGCLLDSRIGEHLTGRFDHFRIEQVLENLLGNAAKYAAGKPVSVSLVREAGNWARLEVRDRGPGIAPEQQEKIFDRFERAVPGRQVAGLGLGLYIARQIIEAHGGVISVQSKSGEGSVFSVQLPLT